MKKRILLVFLAIVLVVSLVAFAACAKEEEAPPVEEEAPPVEEEAPPVEEEWQWPERLLLTTLGTTSPNYGALVSWSTPLYKDTGMVVRIVCEDSVHVANRWVREGRFFTTMPWQNRLELYGSKGWTYRDGGPWQSRIWMAGGKSCNSFCALGDSGIKTPYDIKPGMKIQIFTLAEEPQLSTFALLAWAQVDPEDIVWVPVSHTLAAGRNLMDGKVDITTGYPMSPFWYEVEASPHGLSWMELDAEKDPEGAARFLSWYPYVGFGIADHSDPESSWDVPMAMSIIPYITRAEADPEFVYRLVKWTDENYDKFKEGHPWAAAMTIDNLLELAKIHYEPIHDGAVRYFEEKGLWTEELDARRQYNIEQMTLWVEAYQTAIVMADDRGIVVDHENDEWQEFWENYRDSLNLPLLSTYQGPGKEQPTHLSFYTRWNKVKPEF